MEKSKNTQTENTLNETTVFIFDAEEGMTLSRDILNAEGRLVAAAGTRLDLDIIAKISGYHILEINVLDRNVPEKIKPDEENNSYFNKIRRTEQFKQFHETYVENIATVKKDLTDIVIHNAPIESQSLLDNTMAMMADCTNRLQLFDMLHSLREFDDLTFAHSINVALVASVIGQWLHFSSQDIQVLMLCGLLHDIGKLLIPNEILTKPDRLTQNEFAIMKQHVNLGYERIKEEKLDTRVKEACLLHHEKCNGSGYPFGLKSDKIPTAAKIITIADIYDAMTAARVYRGAICPFEVVRMMEQEAYTKLDPAFCLPFLKNVVSSYIHNNVKLSDGRYGEVILINDHALSRPVVKCGEQFIDLSKTAGVSITAIL